MTYKALVKANNDTLSFCNCEKPQFSTSGQAGCPWCGCGWLFSCVECGKAYVFAKVIETETSPIEIAQRDIFKSCGEQLPDSDGEIIEQANWLETELKDIPVDTICVILDGKILSTNAKDISFEGWFAKHELETLPHATVEGSAEQLESIFGDINYWLDREIEES